MGVDSEKKKPRIVSFTREELNALKGKTNWKKLRNMTDEEINAAIASDPDAEPLGDLSTFQWHPHPPKN